jgi:CarD family transcriptional regulator
MLSVGDKVVHRVHGAGVITARKEMQIGDATDCYFLIRMIGSPSTMMVPTAKAEQNLRPVSQKTTLHHLLMQELADKPDELPADHKERAERIRGKLISGETRKWIQVVRNLTCRKQQGSLSSVDQKLLDRAIHLLAEEFALAQGIEQEKAKSRLLSIVKHVTDANEAELMLAVAS